MSQFYNSIAEKYDAIFPLSPAHRVFFDAEVYGKTVLDVGAGTGNLTAYLRAQGYDVTAIDLSKALIAQATAKDIEVQELNMLAIDTLPMFDTIINIGNTLPHLDNKDEVQTFLIKAYNQLTQGGKLILQMVNFEKYFAQKEGNFLGNLPLIENEKVKFERSYHLNKTIVNEEFLQPILSQELTQWLSQIGFKDLKLYGNFKKESFNPETSMALIVTAQK